MNDDAPKMVKPSNILLNGSKMMHRREFLAVTSKIVIPTLGFLGLSLVSHVGRVRADDCSDCSGSCRGSCSNSCDKGCGSGCSGSCSDSSSSR